MWKKSALQIWQPQLKLVIANWNRIVGVYGFEKRKNRKEKNVRFWIYGFKTVRKQFYGFVYGYKEKHLRFQTVNFWFWNRKFSYPLIHSKFIDLVLKLLIDWFDSYDWSME